MKELFPIHRSITGEGNRKTLQIIQKHIPLTIQEIPTGTQVFDWKIPKEYTIKKAYIKNSKGETIVDIQNNNLHVLSYSRPVNKHISFNELDTHLFYLKDFPDWIPYRTTYYNDTWGFCLTYNQYKNLDKNDTYHVHVDSELFDGSLTYGELIINGQTNKEILISTYMCHPSMCNDNLSGVVVATYLAKHILEQKKNYYTYRFVFVPESIGAIGYLSKNINVMKQHTIGGYVISCIGDDGDFTYLQTRKENQITDKITLFLLEQEKVKYKVRKYYTCGSDERQYNYPGVDLHIGSLMRTKYTEFNEYHTSADNLSFVTDTNLIKSLDMYKKCITIFENNHIYKAQTLCEPRLGIHGLWDTVGGSKKKDNTIFRKILYYCDGTNDVVDICRILQKHFNEVNDAVLLMYSKQLIQKI